MKYLCNIGFVLLFLSCGQEISSEVTTSDLQHTEAPIISELDSLKSIEFNELSRDYILVDNDTIYKTTAICENGKTIRITQQLSIPFTNEMLREYQSGIKTSVLDSTHQKTLEFLFEQGNEFTLSTYILNVKQEKNKPSKRNSE